MGLLLAAVLVLGVATGVLGVAYEAEFQRYDGWYNNLAHPSWGSAGSRLYRKVPSSYADGVYMMDEELPSARAISDAVFRGPDGQPNRRNLTTMFVYFSQVVAYELMQSSESSCPLEMHKIPVPACDSVFDPDCSSKRMMPFTRARYDKSTGGGFNSAREQLNEKTAWIDASFLYSTQEPWVNAMKAGRGGRLKEGHMPDYPPLNSHRIPLINPPPPQIHRLMDPERLFLLGDPRVNENPGLLSFGLILYRWHNRLADRLAARHPEWSDLRLFDSARRFVIATLQNIIMYEFLPALLNHEQPLSPYTGYKPGLPPGIAHVFSAAAFRSLHSLVPPGMIFRLRDKQEEGGNGTCAFRSDVAGYRALRLCQNWWNAQDIIGDYSVDEVILGMASQLAEPQDHIVISDLRDYLFGPMHFSRLDLVAIEIMRGRDNGLGSYNRVRQEYGLTPRNWTSINPLVTKHFPHKLKRLQQLYHHDINRLDVYVGGMLEGRDEGPGELFSAIIREQFRRIRDADRFWFENPDLGVFTNEELAEIRNTSLYDIIRSTTNVQEGETQRSVFFHRAGDPCPQPAQLNSQQLEKCIPFMRYDHFMGNDVTFIFTCIALAVIPIACVGISYLMIRKREKTVAWAVKGAAAIASNGLQPSSILAGAPKTQGSQAWQKRAVEWLHESFSRSVSLVVDTTKGSLLVQTRRGSSVLREMGLGSGARVTVVVSRTASSASPFVLVSPPNDCDLVVQLESRSSAEEFLGVLQEASSTGEGGEASGLRVREMDSEAALLSCAETREKRQKKLERFFREAYTQALKGSSPVSHPELPEAEVLETALTRAEFAETLGMAESEPFVRRMFACVASSHPNKISFADFLTVLRRFTQGSVRERLQIVFDMCQSESGAGGGRVDKREWRALVLSLNTAAGVKLDTECQEELLSRLLREAGVAEESRWLDRAAFSRLLDTVTDSRRPVGLHFRGLHGRGEEKVALEETDSLNSFALSYDADSARSDASWIGEWLEGRLLSPLEDYRQHIFWLFLFYFACFCFFFERYWHYSQENEHRDLRRVMGAGIAWTRGSAAGLSFCFGLLLLTVCRNLITLLRETPLNSFIPFDAAITAHQIIALTAAVFAVVHTVGHCINFYHVATQSHEGLRCLFQEAVFSSDFQPSISYWFFGTVTGLTGVMLVVVMSIIYVFAMPSVIHRAYHAFRLTHLLNVLLYALTIAHGLPKLLDKPRFWCLVLPSVLVFLLDKLIGQRRFYRRLQIFKARLLPSNIMLLECSRPRGLKFRSGQWVRLSCDALAAQFNESHAFSIASAPHEPTLKLYIKAVGPWTLQLQAQIGYHIAQGSPLPEMSLDGPYGGGSQNWPNYKVAVLVGGGIGVTPFASILKDLVHQTSTRDDGKKFSDISCQKVRVVSCSLHPSNGNFFAQVYFLWICASQKNFEFFIEVLREVEALDEARILEVHIFVTQFFHKFDLRTTMLVSILTSS